MIWLLTVLTLWPGGQAPEIRIELVGNAGVLLADGATSILVDLPYESGAFGYMRYEQADLQPTGTVVSVITHHHRDHFDRAHFLARRDWRLIGPPSVTERVPHNRVLVGDSLEVGRFAIVTIPTPHTDDHRSYRIRWRGRIFFFVGDTEDESAIASEPRSDILFITPWLSCGVIDADRALPATRSIAYHLRPNGSDRTCGPVDVLEQGSTIRFSPVRRD